MSDQLDEEESFKTKLRRILLVSDVSHSHELEPILAPYTNDVTQVSLGNWSSYDYLEMPAACVVIDGRAGTPFDREYIVATISRYYPPRPVLLLTDGEMPDHIKSLMHHMSVVVMIEPYNLETSGSIVADFMREMVKYDPGNEKNYLIAIHEQLPLSMAQVHVALSSDDEDELRKLTVTDLAYNAGIDVREIVERAMLRYPDDPEEVMRDPMISDAIYGAVTAQLHDDKDAWHEAVRGLHRGLLMATLGGAIANIGNMVKILALTWGCEPTEAWQRIRQAVTQMGLS